MTMNATLFTISVCRNTEEVPKEFMKIFSNI